MIGQAALIFPLYTGKVQRDFLELLGLNPDLEQIIVDIHGSKVQLVAVRPGSHREMPLYAFDQDWKAMQP